MKEKNGFQVQVAGQSIKLPSPTGSSDTSLEEAILNRCSIRDYKNETVTLEQMGQLLWAGQGINRPEIGKRTAPSAGARYPLELYTVAKGIEGAPPGVYKYSPENHLLNRTISGAFLKQLAVAALNQEWMASAAAVIVITAVFERTTARYGQRGERYVNMDVGIAAQNVWLQAESLGLGTVFVGAFDDSQVHSLLELPADEKPLCLLPLGWPDS